MIFYLTYPSAKRAFELGVPVFVNRKAIFVWGRKKKPYRASAIWCLDSGGYMELKQHGHWTVSPQQYVQEVRRARKIGKLQWAAVLDWMCEEEVLAKTGRSVEEHQGLTIESYLQLRAMAPDLEDLWLPVLQGSSPEDYVRHFEQWMASGVDLRQVNVVGVGSVCRCEEDARIRGIFSYLQGQGLRRLHGFGVKKTSLEWDAVLQRPTRPDVAELYHRAFEKGFPYEYLEATLREDPRYGATTWENEEAPICKLMYSADSCAWSERASWHYEEVKRARDAAYGKGGWVDTRGLLLSPSGKVLGEIKHEQAGRKPNDPLSPTQILVECSLRRAAWRRGVDPGPEPHATDSMCPLLALTYREKIKAMLEPEDCWDEEPYLSALPAPSYEPWLAWIERAGQVAEEYRRVGLERFAHLVDLPPWARLDALRRRGELDPDELLLYVQTLAELAGRGDPAAQEELEQWRRRAREQRGRGENPPRWRWPYRTRPPRELTVLGRAGL